MGKITKDMNGTRLEMEYKYKNIRLTPGVFCDLLMDLFEDKQFDRQTAIECVVLHHKDNGGDIEGVNGIACFKKASQTLTRKGYMKNRAYGTWEISVGGGEIKVEESAKKRESKKNLEADTIVGEGKKAVYLYYFRTYKEIAELKGETEWPCKIGRSDKDPLQRVADQVGTCLPEKPHVALIIKCDDAHNLESAIQSILKLKYKHIGGAGTEWFTTNPSEVERIYRTITSPLP